MNLIYGVKDKPKFGQLIVFAIQQLLAILAATITVPAIVGNDMSAAAALFGAGVGTIVYQLLTKFRSPVFLGSSFAFIGPMLAAFAGGVSMSLGYAGLIIGAAFAGLVYVAIAVAVKFAGVKWIGKIMPQELYTFLYLKPKALIDLQEIVFLLNFSCDLNFYQLQS